MWTATKTTKCCATCVNWGGERKVRGSSSETPGVSTRGKCYENVFCGVTAGPCCHEGRNCPKYKLWGALK